MGANESGTKQAILDAARRCLLAEGYAALSTRKVASEAGVPLSQVHYHFGSKGGMVLALLEARGPPAARPSGGDVLRGRAAVEALRAGVRLPRGRPRVGVRARAAGDDRGRMVEPRDRREGRAMQQGWYELLTDVATEAQRRFGGLGPFTPAEVATLIGCAFIGAEAWLLLGFDRHQIPIRAALRRVGQLIRAAEEARREAAPTGRTGPCRARRRRRALGALWRRQADDPAAADVVDHPVAPLEDAGALPGPQHRWSRSTVAAAACPTDPSDPPPTPTTSTPPTPSPSSTPRPPTGPFSSRLSCGTLWGVQLAADHPDRVPGLVSIGPSVPLVPGLPERSVYPFDEPIDETEGWAKYNAHYWQRDYRDFLEFFFGRDVHRAALHEADRGLRRVGTGDRRRRR